MVWHAGKVTGGLVASFTKGIPGSSKRNATQKPASLLGDIEVGIRIFTKGLLDSLKISFRVNGMELRFHHLAYGPSPKNKHFASGVDIEARSLHLEEKKAARKKAVGDKVTHDDRNHHGRSDRVILIQFKDDEDCGDGCPNHRANAGSHAGKRKNLVLAWVIDHRERSADHGTKT